MKTAIIYDRVNKWGGAERVLLALHEIFPEAPLYTSLYSSEKAHWAKVFPTVIPSFLNRIGYLRDKHQFLAPLMPLAFESFNFDQYDLVVSVSSEAAKGIITKPQTKHICYCLTPTRYLWSGYNDYLQGGTLQGITKPLVLYLRHWDKIAAQRPDVVVAISTEVSNRIKRHYNRDSQVVYPPVDTNKFKTQNSKRKTETQKSKLFKTYNLQPATYYLIISRLEPYKKVDLAINAFNELGYPLVVVGIGSEEKKLRSIAKNNIIFKGFSNEKDLPEYYQNAKGFVFPQEEDFGISAVEAQASGCPVIAYKKGGALDTITENKTGVFFEEQTKESLIDAVKKFEKKKFDKEILVSNAEKYSKERFKKEILDLIKINV